MAHLTSAECKLAADRASVYPKGFGYRFMISAAFGAEETAKWLVAHPEDLDKG
jgi:hypothetical protein